MKARFYINLSDDNVAVKNLQQITETDVEYKYDTERGAPTLYISTNKVNVSKCNYVYLEAFNRYYFATITVSQQHVVVECTCDVLSSFWTNIADLPAIIDRQQNTYNLYLSDSDFRTYQFDNVAFKNFPSTPFTKNLEYILLTL